MTGRDSQPTTRRRSAAECFSIIGLLQSAFFTLCLLGGAGAQEPVRSGSAGPMGGTVSGAAAKDSPGDDKTTPPAQQSPMEVPDAPGAPPFHISEVDVKGAIAGDRANLTVRINVEVNRAGAWHDVPLRLGQASIYRETSAGGGAQVPGQPALQEDGLHWQFYGQGQHKLEFELGVPVRKTAGGKQLQLSLPVMPALFEARLQLKIPGGDYVVRSANRDAALKTIYDKSGNETIVDGGIPGGKLDLSWFDRQQAPPADGVASTIFTLRRRAANLELECVQNVVRMDAPSNDLVVHVPDGFKVQRVESPFKESDVDIPDRPGWRRLTFAEGASERVDLHWFLERPLPAKGEELQLSGFEIQGVRSQDGRIRILPIAGFHLFPQQKSLRYLERVDDVSGVGDSPSLFAYAFSAGDWRMTLNLRPIEPLFACRPRLEVFIREDQATLTAMMAIREEAGDVSRMAVDVSAIEAAGWRPSTGSRPAASGGTTHREGSTVTFDWSQAGNSQKTAELRFERPITGSEFEFPVPSPSPRATWVEPATCLVRAADPLRIDVGSATVSAEGQVDVTPVGESLRLVGTFQASTATEPITIHGSVEARTIAATANVLVEGVESRRITVEQQIMLDVRYGRLDALRLFIPAGFPVTPGAERLAFQVWVDGREATDLEWTSGWLRVPFLRPRIGTIRVSIRYALPRPPEAARLSVPIILTPDVKYHEVTLEASPATRATVDVAAADWKEVVSASERRRWFADPDVDDVELTIEKEKTLTSERAIISAAFIRTEAAGSVQRTVAQYDLERTGESLTITLPLAATPFEILVNGQAADFARGSQPASENQWSIRMPKTSASTSTRLEIAYDLPTPPRGALGRLKVGFPQFPQGTFINQLVWKLVLPESDVLLSSPPGMTRLFEWERRGVFWRRVLSPAYAAALRSIGFVDPDAGTAGDGHAFRQIGGPASLTVWTIDRSLVILFGAGVTLALGFAFWSIRRLQNVVVLLFLAFLVSLAGLWFPEAIQVLLQPALVGVVMATIATAIDGRSRRRRYRAPARESSIHVPSRAQAPRVNDPLRSTILRPTGSDHGAPR